MLPILANTILSSRSVRQGSLDPAARTFFDEAAYLGSPIIDPVKRQALNDLSVALRPLGVFDPEFKWVIYPCLGDDAVVNSLNLVDPSQNRMTWNGAVTHSADGVTGDGVTGYGDTGITYNNAGFTTASGTMAAYVVNSGVNPIHNFGGVLNFSDSQFFLSVDNARLRFDAFGFPTLLTDFETLTGLFTGTRRSSSDVESYYNDTSIAAANSATGNIPSTIGDLVMPVLCLKHPGGTVAFCDDTISLFAVSNTGISAANIPAWSTAVLNFQTALGRAA